MKIGDRIRIFQLNDSGESMSFPKEAEGLQRPCNGTFSGDYDISGFCVYFLPSEVKQICTMVIKSIKK